MEATEQSPNHWLTINMEQLLLQSILHKNRYNDHATTNQLIGKERICGS
jgi:hypothetical protein